MLGVSEARFLLILGDVAIVGLFRAFFGGGGEGKGVCGGRALSCL